MNRRALAMAVKGIVAWVPGARRLRRGSTGGTDSARYCYSVWLRHLVMACTHAGAAPPQAVAELGPGDSLGAGLAAMLSGADRYYALDVVAFADPGRNLQVFDELVTLFRRREPVPDDSEFRLGPALDSYEFPGGVLTDARLARALADDRVAAIRRALADPGGAAGGDVAILYRAPWHDEAVIEPGAVDMVFSQAVLQHVDDLERTYRALHTWLRQGGVTSHQINLYCHQTAPEWNGHWAYSDTLWWLIRGGRPYLINREPYSTHVRLLEQCGFQVAHALRRTDTTGIGRARLAARFRGLSDEDLTTRSAFILARRKAVACGRREGEAS